MVDLDKGRLRYNEKDIQHLPDEHFDAMVNALAKCVANMSGKDADWAPVRPGGGRQDGRWGDERVEDGAEVRRVTCLQDLERVPRLLPLRLQQLPQIRQAQGRGSFLRQGGICPIAPQEHCEVPRRVRTIADVRSARPQANPGRMKGREQRRRRRMCV
eukprot:392536-Hanusia_phi.AAC.1